MNDESASQPSGITQSQSCETLFLWHGIEAYQQLLETLITSGHRQLDILSTNLEPLVFSNSQINNAISALARNHREARVRILIKDPRNLPGSGHQVVALQQRIPSKIQLRKCLIEPQDSLRNYIILDRQQVLYQHDSRIYDGFYNSSAAPEALNLLEEFDDLWQKHSEEILDLRRLQL